MNYSDLLFKNNYFKPYSSSNVYNWDTFEFFNPSEKPSQAQIDEWIANEQLLDCKTQAQLLLNQSDFADLYSVRNKLENIDEWDNYRNQIRELRINPVENPIFPDKPQTIWKEL